MELSLEQKGAAEYKSTIGGIHHLSGKGRGMEIYLPHTMEGMMKLGVIFSSVGDLKAAWSFL